MQLEQGFVKTFANRFVNRLSAYSVQWNNGRGYTAVYEPITYGLINQHLKGELTLSLPALDIDNTGRWLCFDSDSANGTLDQLERFLTHYNWRCLRESKRENKDGHLWLLFDSRISGEHLVNLGNTILRLSEVPLDKLEVFPKQKRIEKLGSGVRLPINFHYKISERTWFDTPAKDVRAQLIWLAQQPLNSSIEAITLAELHKPVVRAKRQAINHNKDRIHRFNILDYVETKRVGKELAAQCPLCAAEGHDRHRDNLRISLDGSKFCCWFGGAAQVHKAADIVRALRRG